MESRGAWGIRCLTYALLAACLVLLAGLARWQLLSGEDLAERARDQRMEAVTSSPARGAILDRHSRALAGGSWRRAGVVVLPWLVRDRARVADLLARIEGAPAERELARLGQAAPFGVAVNDAARVWLGSGALRDPGVVVIREPVRYRPDGLAAHVIGYLDPSGMRGATGIEQLLDRYLRGDGGRVAIAAFLDGKRRLIEGLGIRAVTSGPRGADVRLTIDLDVQACVERIMDERVERGAVVVMEPFTGEILAMASRPGFAPNDLGASLAMPGSPMVNRAIAAYPLGSVFKVVVAAAALESGAIALNSRFTDPGYVDVGSKRFECYAADEGGHGEITFLDAMAYSCNTAFVEAGLELGAPAIVELAEALGFGATTGSGLPSEHAGVLPDAAAMSAQDLANLSIGQGRLSGTPLQVAVMMSAIASGGWLPRPRLVMETVSDDPSFERVFEPAPPVRVLSRDTCRQLTFMLEGVTRWGTGRLAWVEGEGSCGKTGTAETGRVDDAGTPICHAWFAGFAPLDRPRAVIVVLVEGGMSGATSAAPVFAEIARGILPMLSVTRSE